MAEASVMTVDLKVQMKCQCLGCPERIGKIVSKTVGVHDYEVDVQKELVTVKGTMDVNALVKDLKDKLKKKVEIVPPKKEKDNNNEGGENGGGSKKKKKKGGNGGDEANAGGAEMEYVVDQLEFRYMQGYLGYGYLDYGYGYSHSHMYRHAYLGYVEKDNNNAGGENGGGSCGRKKKNKGGNGGSGKARI